MKKIIFLAVLFAVTVTNSYAEKVDCATISKMASAIMSARQAGVPITDIMKITSDNQGVNNLRDLYVKRAYSTSRFYSTEMQEHAVVEFGNSAYLECKAALKE